MPLVVWLLFVSPVPEAHSGAVSVRGKCGACHKEIAEEWQNSLHAKAWTDSLFQQELKAASDNQECKTCHAPEKVRVKGLGQPPGVRANLQEIGVDCVVCHAGLKDEIHAPYTTGEAMHDVKVDPQHATHELCASCHAAFGTVAEFQASSAAKSNQSCVDCHMPKVKRPVSKGAASREVRQHTWEGGGSPNMFKKAAKVEATKVGNTVTVKVTNIGSGHNLPTGTHFKSIVVDVTAGAFHKQEVIMDASKSGGKDNRIKPGESATFTFDTGAAGAATVKLLSKPVSTMPDDKATVVQTLEVLSDDNEEVQLRQPVFQTDTTKIAPGATVDNYTTFNHICGKCHNGRGANPSDAALGLVNGQLTNTGTARPNMHDSNQFNMLAGFGGVDLGGAIAADAHFNIRGQCSSCHMFNGAGRHTFTVKLDNCQPCHSIADAAARRNAIQSAVINELLALRSRLGSWAQATFGDPALWDYTALIQEEGKAPPNQAQVPIQIRRARHNYYFVVRDASLGVHNGKYARFLIDVANEQLDELNVPLQRVLPNVKQGRAILQSDRLRATRADMNGLP